MSERRRLVLVRPVGGKAKDLSEADLVRISRLDPVQFDVLLVPQVAIAQPQKFFAVIDAFDLAKSAGQCKPVSSASAPVPIEPLKHDDAFVERVVGDVKRPRFPSHPEVEVDGDCARAKATGARPARDRCGRWWL